MASEESLAVELLRKRLDRKIRRIDEYITEAKGVDTAIPGNLTDKTKVSHLDGLIQKFRDLQLRLEALQTEIPNDRRTWKTDLEALVDATEKAAALREYNGMLDNVNASLIEAETMAR